MSAYDKALLLQLIIQTRWAISTYEMLKLANDMLEKTMQINNDNGDV